MSKVNSGWAALDTTSDVLTYPYSFGGGRATALAVRGPEGLVVVSPPSRVPDAAFVELEAHGKVRALVAPNAYHHLGLPAWKARYPDADVFAPAQSIARVQRKSGLNGVRPLADARDVAGDAVELVDMPHYRTGEVLVKVRAGSEVVWYVTDLIMNMPTLPNSLPIRLLFQLTGSAPGLRWNGFGPVIMVKDKTSLRGWLREEIDKAPPSVFIPCHGTLLRMPTPGKELLGLFPSSAAR